MLWPLHQQWSKPHWHRWLLFRHSCGKATGDGKVPAQVLRDWQRWSRIWNRWRRSEHCYRLVISRGWHWWQRWCCWWRWWWRWQGLQRRQQGGGGDRGLHSEDIQERGERRSSTPSPPPAPLISQQFGPAAPLGSLPGSFSWRLGQRWWRGGRGRVWRWWGLWRRLLWLQWQGWGEWGRWQCPFFANWGGRLALNPSLMALPQERAVLVWEERGGEVVEWGCSREYEWLTEAHA